MDKSDISKIQNMLKKVSTKGSDLVSKERQVISLSPQLNYLLSGGITAGSFTVLTGIYKGGKTATALYIAKKAQEAGYKIVYCNAEHRLTKRDLSSIYGLDLEQLELISSTPGNILSAEDFLQIAQYKITSEEDIFLIVDSVSQMCPKELQTGDITQRFRDPTPALLSRFSKVLAPSLSISNNIFMCITHEIANTSGMGHKTTVEASGRKIQYALDFKLRITHTKPWMKGDRQIGQNIHWKCLNSALGPPNREGVGKLLYNHGIEELAELLDLADIANLPFIKKKSSWYEVDGVNIHGENKLIEHIKNEKELLEKIKKEVSERLGVII